MSLDVLLDPVTGDLPPVSRHGSGREIVAQRLRVRFQTHLRDWKLDKSVGIDWIGILSQKTVDVEGVAATLAVVAKQTPGVRSVGSLSWEHVGRQVSITMRVVTADAEILEVTSSPQGSDGNPSIAIAFLGHAGAIAPR